jgi:hypothetical protein
MLVCMYIVTYVHMHVLLLDGLLQDMDGVSLDAEVLALVCQCRLQYIVDLHSILRKRRIGAIESTRVVNHQLHVGQECIRSEVLVLGFKNNNTMKEIRINCRQNYRNSLSNKLSTATNLLRCIHLRLGAYIGRYKDISIHFTQILILISLLLYLFSCGCRPSRSGS